MFLGSMSEFLQARELSSPILTACKRMAITSNGHAQTNHMVHLRFVAFFVASSVLNMVLAVVVTMTA